MQIALLQVKLVAFLAKKNFSRKITRVDEISNLAKFYSPTFKTVDNRNEWGGVSLKKSSSLIQNKEEV